MLEKHLMPTPHLPTQLVMQVWHKAIPSVFVRGVSGAGRLYDLQLHGWTPTLKIVHNFCLQTHRHTDTLTQRHTDTQTHRHTDTQTHRKGHKDTQTHGHTDTDANKDRKTDTQTYKLVGKSREVFLNRTVSFYIFSKGGSGFNLNTKVLG